MEINRDFYREENDVKLPTSYDFYRNAYINSDNFLVNQSLDTTPTYMKVKHDDNVFNNVGIIQIGKSPNNLEEFTVTNKYTFETPDSEFDNLMLIYNAPPLLSGNTSSLLTFNARSEYEWGTQCEVPHELKSSSSNPNYKPAVITRFSYTQFKLAPFVTAYNEDFTQYRETTLQQWDVVNYPNVVYIRVASVYNEVMPVSPILSYTYQYDGIIASLIQNTAKSLLYSSLYPINSNTFCLFGTPFFNRTIPDSLTSTRFNYVRLNENLKVKTLSSNNFVVYCDNLTHPKIAEYMDNLGLIWGANGLAGSLTDENTHIPNINDNGELTGGSTTGQNNANQPQYNWTKPDDVFKNNGVIPEQANSDDNITTNKTSLNTP